MCPHKRCYSCDILSSSGITRLHRYYDAIRLPPSRLPFSLYYQLSGILAALTARERRISRVAVCSLCSTCHGLRPRGGATDLPFTPMNMLTSVHSTTSSLPSISFEAQSLQPVAYGLPTRYPTLNLGDYSRRSKDSLPGGWPTFRGGLHTR